MITNDNVGKNDYPYQTKLVNSNLDWDPVRVSGAPTGKHLKIVVAAVLRVAVRCCQHSDASLSCQFNQARPDLGIQVREGVK